MEHLIEIGLYNEDYLINEDKEILKRFKNKFKIYNCPLHCIDIWCIQLT